MKSEDENVITQNSNLIIVHVEQQRRKIILKRLLITEEIESFIMKEFSSSKKKKLTLQNLIRKFKKKLKIQALKKLRSFREKNDMNIEINDKTYHVEMIIRHLHSCARFFFDNFIVILQISKSSLKLTKSTTNKILIRIYCEIVKDTIENKM
jgi:hypothetical protein